MGLEAGFSNWKELPSNIKEDELVLRLEGGVGRGRSFVLGKVRESTGVVAIGFNLSQKLDLSKG